jgi:uncharacterized membrane protein YgdD (TMEM256/DUF423 family)
MSRGFVAAGALLAALAIGLGAFGAHALKGMLDAQQAGWFETAARYHLIHGVGLVAVGLAAQQFNGRALRIAGWSMLLGTLIFSGTLYAMALGAPRWFGAITPIGGVALITAWLSLALSAVSSKK